ncbi:hypothetical protein AB0O22_17010 [Streptomyces sp. NPDC091204]|uniref:hypothetical protein n=1 Tax=Streptomyces sp. NPDC091204 TaxID=3155299 RepID=UPI0034124F26
MSTNTPNPDTTAGNPTPQATAHPATTTVPAEKPARTVKVMAVLIAILFAAACALGAFILTRQLGASPLGAVGASGATFLGVSGTALYIEEKLGIL